MHARNLIALGLVLVLIAPPPMSAGSPQTPSADAPAGPRASDSWWDYGWIYRRPVTIDNTGNSEGLVNYQLLMNISFDGDMRPDFSDVRFAQYNQTLGYAVALPYYIESKADGAYASVWVNVSDIAAQGNSTIYMYYGNPSASSASNSTRTFDLFDDFEGVVLDTSKWAYSTGATLSGGILTMMSSSSETAASARSFAAFGANTLVESRMRQYKTSTVALQAGLSYRVSPTATDKIIYMLDYNSLSGPPDTYALYVDSTGDGKYEWSLTNTGGPLSDAYHVWGIRRLAAQTVFLRDSTTTLASPAFGFVDLAYIKIGCYNADGSELGMINMAYDWIRVRRYAPAEPKYSIGPEELSFKFKSMSYSPQRMSDGDMVFINATFNNPSPGTIKLSVAAKEGDDYNSSKSFYQDDVTLAPSSDTAIPFTWTAKGGTRTIWLAVYDFPVASVKIKVNRDPILAPVKDQSLLQDKEFVLQLNASDPDGDALEWSIDNSLFDLTTVSNRSAEISFLPTNDDVGIHRANVTVRDPMNRSDTKRINLTVNNVNDPPVLAKIPSLAATQYNEFLYQAKASDIDLKWGDILTFSDNTDLFDINEENGEFSFTPTEEQVGKHAVKITVTDIGGASDSCTFTLSVANVNDPPTLEILPPQFATQGRLFQLKVVASDPDLKSDPTEKLRFSDDSPLFAINNDTGMISFTPTNEQIGVWPANITVTDKGGLSSTTQLTITVMNVNDPPSIEAIAAQTATEDRPFQYQVNASDPDLKWGLDNLTFTDDTDLFNIDPKTGAISFTPTGAQVGIKRVTITVKDEKGASASASFDLTVVHVNHPPTDAVIKYPLDRAKLKEGDDMWLDGTARDSDKGDVLQYNWLDNGEPAGTGKNISVKLKPGKHTITLEVSDGSETVSTEISVEVEKKQTVTVASSGTDWLPLAAAAAAVVAIVALVVIVAARRRRRPNGPEAPARARVSLEGEDVALPPVPPAEAGPKGSGEEAQKVIDSTVEKLADYQEAHPEESIDVAPVMEKLDIARDFLKSGENDDALDFANEAKAAVDKMTAPTKPKRVAVKKKKVV
jgi:hypothetical protein